MPIGTAANAYSYGYAGGQRSIIWADPMLNTITHFHRMGGALDPGGYSGDLGYDVSTDGGASWTNQVEVYVAEDNEGGEYYFDSGRYPAHGLYNPSGSLDDARVVFFAAALDATNSDTDSGWGGYAFGTGLLSDTSVHTRLNLTSEGDVYREVPEGYEMSDLGVSYGLGANEDWTSGALVYQQQLILDKGVWSDDEEDFVYTEMLIDAECTDDMVAPSNHKIAFGADGMTGYIALLSDNGEAEQLSGFVNVYPLFMKTEDGGETWTEQQFIQLDGQDGIGGIVYHHLTDEQIAELPGPVGQQGCLCATDLPIQRR